MSAGVGKTYRMLEEVRDLLDDGVNVQIGYVETHGRAETHALLEGLPVIPRREVFYKGKRLDEFDLNATLLLHPEWVVVDELAHTNVPGSKHAKRWQDVLELLDNGINVITAVNIQHIESINDEVQRITGVEVTERVPDSFLQRADEVVNIDLTAAELIDRLKEGKIYDRAKVETALRNFFQPEKILQLRELALKEVAGQVERKVEQEVETAEAAPPRAFPRLHQHQCRRGAQDHPQDGPPGQLLPQRLERALRADARRSDWTGSRWTNSATCSTISSWPPNLGAEVIQAQSGAKQSRGSGSFRRRSSNLERADITEAILRVVKEKRITTLCIGKPHISIWQVILRTNTFNKLLTALARTMSTW